MEKNMKGLHSFAHLPDIQGQPRSTLKFFANTGTKNNYLKRQGCGLVCWVAQLW